jgi:thymidylate synthase
MILNCTTVADAWIKTHKHLDEHGIKTSGIREVPNLTINISDFRQSKTFDRLFRKIFGDERIDYPSSYSFVDPRTKKGYVWRQNEDNLKWTATYWGRLINWQGQFNQIEQAMKRLKEHKSSKTIVAAVFDPISDGKKVMGGLPCLLSVDFKPRDEGLHLTCFFRSMRFNKSGYGDFDAFVRLGLFLAEECGLKLHRVSFIAGSGHIGGGEEYKNMKTLLTEYENAKSKSRRG